MENYRKYGIIFSLINNIFDSLIVIIKKKWILITSWEYFIGCLMFYKKSLWIVYSDRSEYALLVGILYVPEKAHKYEGKCYFTESCLKNLDSHDIFKASFRWFLSKFVFFKLIYLQKDSRANKWYVALYFAKKIPFFDSVQYTRKLFENRKETFNILLFFGIIYDFSK